MEHYSGTIIDVKEGKLVFNNQVEYTYNHWYIFGRNYSEALNLSAEKIK